MYHVHTTHLCHVTQIRQNQKCCPMSHFLWEFSNKPILLHHDNVIKMSFPPEQGIQCIFIETLQLFNEAGHEMIQYIFSGIICTGWDLKQDPRIY